MAYAERRNGKLNGRWIGEVELRKGGLETRLRRRFDTKKEAEGYEAYVRATGEEPATVSADPSGSFKNWSEKFRTRNPEWGKDDRSAVQRLEWLLSQPIAHMDVKSITTDKLDDIVAVLRKRPVRAGGKGLSNRTINRYLDAVSCVLRFAWERGAIQGMPHVPRLENKGNDRKAVLSFEMEDAVCNWIEANRDPRIAFVIRVLVETGFRKGELWKIRPEQIGDESVTLDETQTKTHAARTVYVPADMAKKLRAMIAADALPHSFQVYEVFKLAVKHAGGPSELTLHSLRHTKATRLMAHGTDGSLTSKILGHSTPVMSYRYSHPDLDAIKAASKKVQNARGENDHEVVLVDFATKKNTA